MIDPRSRHERGGNRRGKGDREGQVNLIDGRIKGEGRGEKGEGRGEMGKRRFGRPTKLVEES